MKYDVEYDSYRFNSVDMSILIKALSFYNQYNPLLEQGQMDYIQNLIKDLEKSTISIAR